MNKAKRKAVIAGNWKMNKTATEAASLIDALVPAVQGAGCDVVICTPFTSLCIGCGLCTTKCEFDAIHLSRELPECSRMVRSEDKFKAILPYMIKREMKIRFGKKDG